MTAISDVERLVAAVLDAAQRAMDQGQWDDASALARQVLAVVPEEPSATALLMAADARGSRGAADQGRRYLTVLFSDVVASTPLSERLDPEDYLVVISAYRDVVRELVARHDGHVDQFQGDGVVAYFGFPVTGEDDQVRAVEAGLEIVRAVPEAGRRIGVDLQARIGIHVGRTVLTSSDLGVRDRNTAIGFVTNVAARIQSLAAPGAVVVSETAIDAISPYFDLELVGAQRLRGVSEDVRVFTVAAPRAPSTMADDRLAAPLVGRTAERARIDAAWNCVLREDVVDGDGARLLVLVGEPGIGKSRLVRYAMDAARDHRAGIIEINCGRGFRHVGLGAIRRGIEKALELRSVPRPGEIRRALRARVEAGRLSEESAGVLESMMGDAEAGSPIPALAPDRLREAIIGALLEWIAGEAAVAPLALVIEDLQWADDTALETFRRLATRALPPGLLVLMTVRTGEMPALLKPLLRDAIELEPLPGTTAREMVRAFAPNDELDDTVVDILARRGEGVPLFTEHLVMAATAGSGRTDDALNDVLPATLEGLLQVRLNATGPGRAVAEVAAVIGREFSLDLIERALEELGPHAPLPSSGVANALRALHRAGLVESEGPDTMRFRHSLVRDTAYEMQLRTELPRRHSAVARAIIALRGPDSSPEGLAYHFEQAGDFEPAAGAYLRAAEDAANLAEFDIALEQLRHAGVMIEQLGPPACHRLELARCMQLGQVYAASFSYAREDAERAYLRALELCDLIGAAEGADPGLDVQLVAALGGLWSRTVVAGDLRAARAVTDRLEQLMLGAPTELKPEIRRFVLGCRGFELLFAGATTEAVETLREASAMEAGPVVVPLGTPHDYVAAVDALLAAELAVVGDDEGVDEALTRALLRTTQLPFPVGPFSEAVVRVYAAYVYRLRGDVDSARTQAVTVSEIGDRHGFREHSMLGQILLLAANVMESDLGSCQAMANVLGVWRMAGGGLAVPWLLAELAEGFLRAGDCEGARTALADAATMMEQTDQRGCEPELVRIGALVDLSEGATADDVVRSLRAAAQIALAQGSVRVGARSVRDATELLGTRVDPDIADVAGRLRAQLQGPAGTGNREIERWLSVPTG